MPDVPQPPPTEFPPEYLAEDNSGRVIAAVTAMFVTTTILYALRLYARSLTQVKRGWDDHILIPAYFCLVGNFACLYCEVTMGGLGRHAAAVMMDDPIKLRNFSLLLYILDWFYVPSNMLSRMSVVILYLRIFTNRWARIACWAVMAFLAGNCLSMIIAAQLECTPLAFTWDKTIEGGKCFDLLLWYQLANFPNIAADVMIMALPIRTVWSLKASTARKSGIAAVCLLGSIGLIASCVRTSVFYMQADVINNDPTFSDEAFSWTAVECGMYFSAACLIGMRPLLGLLSKRFKHHIGATTNQNMGSSAGRHGDDMRLKAYGKASQYSTIKNDDDDEVALRSGSEPSPSAPREIYLGQQRHYRQPSSNDIRVETNIEIRRGDRREMERDFP